MWRTNGMREADYTDVLELTWRRSSRASRTKRPQDRVRSGARRNLPQALAKMADDASRRTGCDGKGSATTAGKSYDVKDGTCWSGDHELHHTSNPRYSSRPASSPAMRTSAAQVEAVGEDQPCARFARRHGYLQAAGLLANWSPSLLSRSATAVRLIAIPPRAPEISEAVKARRDGRRAVGQPQLRGRVHRR